MSTATWIRDELDQRGVKYHECHHAEAFTAQALAHQEHISGHRVAKVVIVMADGRPVELILPATRRVVIEWVRALLGAREVRLATETEMDQYFTGCESGAIPALRHWQDVEVLMDRTLETSRDIVFQAGTHCDAVRLHFEDWLRLVNPRVERFSEPTTDRPASASAY
jgi:Ala-tRNA(Pro) deacylase